jgi:hypothetical protein
MSEPDAIGPEFVHVLTLNSFWDSLPNRAGTALDRIAGQFEKDVSAVSQRLLVFTTI